MGRVGSNSGEHAFSIQRCVGMLHQNKHVAREEGLKDLVAALEGFVLPEEIVDCRYEQALDRCFSFLNTGGSVKERKDAYRAIGIYALTVVGSKAQIILDRLFNLDRLSTEIAPSSASDAESAVAAINCLAAVTLVCAKKAAAAKRTLKAVCEVIDQTAVPKVLATALSAWTLLLPRASDLRSMTPFRVIAKHLRADDPAVRMAAGEALAVCFELHHRPYQPDPPPAYQYRYYKPEIPKPEHRPSLESRVAELATGVEAHKKEHAEERALFRRIKDLLEANPPGPDDDDEYDTDTDEEEEEEEEEESSGCRVKVNKKAWVKLVLVNFLRQYLGEEGFAAHFQFNLPLFRDSLGLTRAAGGAQKNKALPPQEMKQLRNGRDKQRTKNIKKDRQNKNKQYY